MEIYGSQQDETTEYPNVAPDTHRNVDCWKVDWKFVFRHQGSSASVPCTIWVDKSDVSHVLRIESRFENGGILYVDGVDSESVKDQNGIWFPKVDVQKD